MLTPIYIRPEAFSSFAANPDDFSCIPAGGNWNDLLSNKDLIWSSALLIVAVDPIILALPLEFLQNSSIAISYKPIIEPSGPEIRWSSSWIIRSGGCFDVFVPNSAFVSVFFTIWANLSTVPIMSEGGFL